MLFSVKVCNIHFNDILELAIFRCYTTNFPIFLGVLTMTPEEQEAGGLQDQTSSTLMRHEFNLI
jgi:hypothetical protein